MNELQWTKDQPTKPGWYGTRLYAGSHESIEYLDPGVYLPPGEFTDQAYELPKELSHDA